MSDVSVRRDSSVGANLRNAFNSVDRAVLLREVEERVSALYPYAHACYSTPAMLFGNGFELESSCGVRQGDVCGPAMGKEQPAHKRASDSSRAMPTRIRADKTQPRFEIVGSSGSGATRDVTSLEKRAAISSFNFRIRSGAFEIHFFSTAESMHDCHQRCCFQCLSMSPGWKPSSGLKSAKNQEEPSTRTAANRRGGRGFVASAALARLAASPL